MHNTCRLVALSVVGTVMVPDVANAADPQSLSTDVPIQVEDAFLTLDGVMTLQGTAIFTHDRFNSKGPNGTTAAGTVKVGAFPELQIDLRPSDNFGNQSDRDSGAATVNALYELNKNSTYIPAFTIHAYYGQPYGAGHLSQEWTFRAIATKYLGRSERSPRLDINLTDYRLDQPDSSQRKDQLEAVIGLSALLTGNTAIVGNVVHGAKPAVGQVQTVVNIGLCHPVDNQWSISGGIGPGASSNHQNSEYSLISTKSSPAATPRRQRSRTPSTALSVGRSGSR